MDELAKERWLVLFSGACEEEALNVKCLVAAIARASANALISMPQTAPLSRS